MRWCSPLGVKAKQALRFSSRKEYLAIHIGGFDESVINKLKLGAVHDCQFCKMEKEGDNGLLRSPSFEVLRKMMKSKLGANLEGKYGSCRLFYVNLKPSRSGTLNYNHILVKLGALDFVPTFFFAATRVTWPNCSRNSVWPANIPILLLKNG